MKPNKEDLINLSNKMSVADIALYFKVSYSTARNWLKYYNIKLQPRGYWHKFITKYKYNEKIFTNEDDISYYLLGVFLTDGCMKEHCVCLCSKDRDWLEQIKNLICDNLPITKEKSNCYTIRINHFIIRQWLLNHGCTKRKSLTLQFPDVPKQYMPDFLRGCIDGDGSITHKQYVRHSNGKQFYSTHCSITSGSKEFIYKLSDCLKDKHINHCIMQRIPGKTKKSIIDGREIQHKNIYYDIISGHKSALTFLKWTYYPNHKISLLRKKYLADKIIDFYL